MGVTCLRLQKLEGGLTESVRPLDPLLDQAKILTPGRLSHLEGTRAALPKFPAPAAFRRNSTVDWLDGKKFSNRNAAEKSRPGQAGDVCFFMGGRRLALCWKSETAI